MAFTKNNNLVFIDSTFLYFFQQFIRLLEFYKLNPSYFSSPGLSWDLMLKMTEIKLKLISGIYKYYFVEKELRGGISYISKRFSETNKKYMKNYDPTKESKYTTDLDANNLYGWAMSQYLPYGEIKWAKNVDNFDVNSISKNNLYGYILEVDLEYPDELNNLHKDYPLVTEKLKLLLICCQIKIADKYNIKVGGVKKLVPNLGLKKLITCSLHYYIILQLYLSLRIKLIKIHKILKFKQSDWVKKNIEFNTGKKKKWKKWIWKKFVQTNE